MVTNATKLSAVLSCWLQPMGDAVAQRLLGAKLSGINEWAKSMFPLSRDYSITNDLAFLIKPSVNMIMTPAISKMLHDSGIGDEQIPAWANRLVEAMEDEVKSKGSITLFESLSFTPADICELKGLVQRNLPVVEEEDYIVL